MDEQTTKPLTNWEQDSSFLPEDYVKSKGERRANLLSLSLFGVMMLAVVAAFFATNKKWMTVRDEKRSVNALYVQEAGKIDELKALETQRDELIKKAEVTAALVERVPRSLLFAEIVRRMPQEVKLLELDLESEQIKKARPSSKKSAGVRTLSGAGSKRSRAGAKDAEDEDSSLVPEYRQSLTLVGVGRDNDNIADYIESLKNCAIFTGVELQYIKETTIDSADLRKFELRARIRPGVDARGLVNPDQPVDLPEVLDPQRLVPTAPIILPPSQLDESGEPIRPEVEPTGAAAFFGGAFDTIRNISQTAQTVTPVEPVAPTPFEDTPVEVTPAPQPESEVSDGSVEPPAEPAAPADPLDATDSGEVIEPVEPVEPEQGEIEGGDASAEPIEPAADVSDDADADNESEASDDNEDGNEGEG
ncbi:MAG: PilN domain-containing protein [Planctomycetota bacterium]